jgi:hypothetical protein
LTTKIVIIFGGAIYRNSIFSECFYYYTTLKNKNKNKNKNCASAYGYLKIGRESRKQMLGTEPKSKSGKRQCKG